MARFSLHAIGRDRPGIVAGVAGALAEIGCNLEDSRMTVLNGQFAIMLIVDAKGIDDSTLLERSLHDVAAKLDLLIAVRPISTESFGDDITSTVSVSIHGADHPGIVAHIADAIAEHNGNVVDLETRVLETDTVSTYVMLLTVGLPSATLFESFRAALDEAAERMGVRCVVSLIDNELL